MWGLWVTVAIAVVFILLASHVLRMAVVQLR